AGVVAVGVLGALGDAGQVGDVVLEVLGERGGAVGALLGVEDLQRSLDAEPVHVGLEAALRGGVVEGGGALLAVVAVEDAVGNRAVGPDALLEAGHGANCLTGC